MLTDEVLIKKAKKLFESCTGWGDSNSWTNQDFVILSEKIQERTGEALSHVTLKRVWGKVKYESLPNTHTLNTLVRFLGYESWRDFASKNGNGTIHAHLVTEVVTATQPGEVSFPVRKPEEFWKIPLLIGGPVILVAILLVVFVPPYKQLINNADYTFSSKKIVTEGLPNSVIFNFDATKSPYDSVIIQQSWDKHLQVRVPKTQHQHTSIYYYPDYYRAKLIVGGKIVSMHRLLIKSNGWLPIIAQTPVPIYLDKKDVMVNGKLSLSVNKIQSRNVNMQPAPPTVLFTNVGDFGPVYSDDFVFESSIRNDYREGAAVCQLSKIYLLCEGTAIGIPLCAKGCISTIDMLFTNFYTSGKQEDLSAFGVDFSSFVKVRIESKNQKARILLNDKVVYTVNKDIVRAKIIGIYFQFQGTGSVDYVKLSNGTVNYDDEF
jgi:hypothetical protein